MKKHTTTVLSAMVTGMDDRDDPDDFITLEAMNGLSKILAQVEEDNVRAILLNIALRIRPCFEKSKVQKENSCFDNFHRLLLTYVVTSQSCCGSTLWQSVPFR